MTVTVAFSLYGNDPTYSVGAIRNAELYALHRPDWVLRFFVGRSVSSEAIATIRKANPLASITEVDERENSASTWWRMRALLELPEVFMSRDCDSRPSLRELDAVDEWLASDFNGHAMRDFQWHAALLLAGLWGCKSFSVAAIANRIPYSVPNFWTCDQIQLQHVYSMLRRIILVHLGCDKAYERIGQRRPFRIPREPGTFVGQGLRADGTTRFPEHVTDELILSDEYLKTTPLFEDKYRNLYAGG